MKITTGACGLLAALLLAGTAAGGNVYVVPTNAAAAAPYDTWSKAATSIQTAVDYASAHIQSYNTVMVSNGTYRITNQIVIARGITVRSVEGGLSGAAQTIVQPEVRRFGEFPSRRLFNSSDANAVIQGFTIQNAFVSAFVHGNAVYMSAGLVRDCIIQNNGFCDNHNGSGVYMTGGTVSNCVIRNNGGGSNVNGSGVYANGGEILNCQILDNALWGREGQSAGGGGIFAAGPVLIRNCLIARNKAGGSAGGEKGGGGVYLDGGTIENCTIIANSAIGENGGGGIYRGRGTAGTIRNSIVYHNTSGHAVYSNMYSTTETGVSYCCTTSPVVAGDGCIAGSPLFVNAAAGDYRLQVVPVKSPCIDAGLNLDWMASARDVAGRPRLFQGAVDMGACEAWPMTPLLGSAGVSNATDKTALVRCNVTWPGDSAPVLYLCHGPNDAGTNRQAWANEVRLPGPIGVGFHDAAISHAASNSTWCYRWFATNAQGAAWAETSGGFMLGAVDVKVTRRESTEAKPAAFVISRPAAATNGPLEVHFTLGGTGVNGEDYDQIDIPAIIPAGATEIRLPVVPNFNMTEKRSKGVELTLAPGGYLIGVNGTASIVTRPEP